MFNHTAVHIYARKAGSFSDAISLTAIFKQADGFHVLKPIEIDEEPLSLATYTEPTISLAPEQAQFLMDSLWDCGLRPTEGKGSAGALAATEAHLKDMRQIATQLLNDKLKLNTTHIAIEPFRVICSCAGQATGIHDPGCPMSPEYGKLARSHQSL